MPRGHLNNSCFGHLRPVLFGVKASAPRATYLPGVSERIVTRSTYVKRTPSLMPSCVNRTKTSYIRGPGFFVTPSAPTCSQNIGRTRGQTPPPAVARELSWSSRAIVSAWRIYLPGLQVLVFLQENHAQWVPCAARNVSETDPGRRHFDRYQTSPRMCDRPPHCTVTATCGHTKHPAPQN
jgi:hypothetical protein